MVEVCSGSLATGVREAVAAGDQPHALLEVGRVLVAGQPDPIGQIPHGPHLDVGVPDQVAQPVERDRAESIDAGDS